MITLNKTQLQNFEKIYNLSRHEILILLKEIMRRDYTKLFFQDKYEISEKDYETFKLWLHRRSNGEPIAKIIEKKEFYGNLFKTTKNTLDPRPETELLIDIFRDIYQNYSCNLKILDLGAGTGCIGISILKLYKNATCCFVDISKNAISIAKQNATSHYVYNRSKFVISNWFKNIRSKFDIIISNPPYVSNNYNLDRETLYDPAIALFGGNNGLDAYKVILPYASKYLSNNGILIIEIGFDQSEKIKNIQTDLKLLSIKHDLAGHNRACVFCKNCFV